MFMRIDSEKKLLVAVWLCAVSVLVLDLLVARGYAVWVLYLLPTMLLAKAQRARSIVAGTVAVVLALVLGFVFSPAGVPILYAVVNRLFGVAIVCGLAWVISKQKRRQWELEAFDSYKQAILDAAPIGAHTYEIDREGKLRFRGKNRYAIETLNGEAVLGKSIFVAPGELHPSTLKLVRKEILERIGLEGGEWTEFIALHEHGNERYFDVHVVQIRPGDLAVFFRDITEIRRAEIAEREAREAAEQASRLKDHFIASVSHEIRTPLNVIQGFISLLEDADTRDIVSMEECLANITAASRRLTRTVELIMSSARLRSGLIHAEPMKTDLAALLSSLAAGFEPIARRKGLQLRVENHATDSNVETDGTLLSQALSNFIDNAIKFTSEGTITISLARSVHGDGLTIVVRDEGVGIDAEFLPHIFEPYTQESIGYSRSFEGLGLGLHISREYLRLLGMHLEISSEQGGGTCVTVTVPKGIAETHPAS